MGAQTVIAYCRVSTSEQVTNGHGLDVQRSRILAWTNFQNLPEPTIFEDAAMSGMRDDRPQFRAALRAALQAGPDAVFLCYRLDRLGRDAISTQEVLALLTDAKVRVVAISDGLDTASGLGASVLKLVSTLLAAMASLERETIKNRLQDGRRRADEANRIYGSEPRYGRRPTDDGYLLPDENEQAAISRARELHGQGHTLRGIAALLDAEGYRPRRAVSWNHVVVGRLIQGRPPAKPKGGTSTRLARLRAELLDSPEIG